ncbi:MAG: hypothetical protein IPL61_40720 [Myxococcales bacterium]|nr:hypothetical protein [Myxococcales bacterium]
MLALLLRLALALPAPPAPAPAVVGAHAIPGAVVFDLDRGEQWTVAIDDDGRALTTTIDRADRAGRAAGPLVASPLPARIDRIDLTDDGAAVIVHGAGRTVAVALTPA